MSNASRGGSGAHMVHACGGIYTILQSLRAMSGMTRSCNNRSCVVDKLCMYTIIIIMNAH